MEHQPYCSMAVTYRQQGPRWLPALRDLHEYPPADANSITGQHITEMVLVAIDTGDTNERGRGSSNGSRDNAVLGIQGRDDRTHRPGIEGRKERRSEPSGRRRRVSNFSGWITAVVPSRAAMVFLPVADSFGSPKSSQQRTTPLALDQNRLWHTSCQRAPGRHPRRSHKDRLHLVVCKTGPADEPRRWYGISQGGECKGRPVPPTSC